MSKKQRNVSENLGKNHTANHEKIFILILKVKLDQQKMHIWTYTRVKNRC